MDLETIKQYGWYLFGTMGVVFFWEGIWDGIGNIGPLKNPLLSLGTGIILLSLTKFLFPGNAPFLSEKHPAHQIVKSLHTHPQKNLFNFKYRDEVQNKEINISAENMHRYEKNFIVIKTPEGRETFIPLHRLKEVLYEGKTHWKEASTTA